MKILVSYRGIPQSKGWATGDSVVRAFRDLGHTAHAYAKYYQRNEWVEEPECLLGTKWDLVLMMECNDGDPQYYNSLFSAKADHKASWFFDASMNSSYQDNWIDLCEFLPFNFIANEKLVGVGSKTTFLPYGADLSIHTAKIDQGKVRDVALVGSDREDRRELIKKLRSNGIKADLISDVFRGDYINTLASSRVCLNDIAGGGSGMLPMRTFEAPAAPSMLLTPSNEGAESLFGDTVEYYSSDEEMIEKCRLILEDEDKLISNTRRLYDHVVKNHTYKKRCEFILETIYG